MPEKHTKGWERGREMRKWRRRKGGKKPGKHVYMESKLGRLSEDWAKEQGRHGLSRATIETRRGLIRRFLRWCWKREVTEPEWLSPGLIQEWFDWLEGYRTRKGTPLAAASREGLLRAVNTFMDQPCGKRGVLPATGMSLLRKGRAGAMTADGRPPSMRGRGLHAL